MIADLRSYPAMKDSGMPWLGQVPAHWEARRLRHAVRMSVSTIDKHTRDSEIPVRLCNYVDVYKNEQITDRLRFMRATATREEVDRFRLHYGDVLITKDSEVWTDIGVPALVEYEAPDLVSGYHLALLRPRPEVVTGGYLLRALQSKPVSYQFHVEANGVTRYGLSHAAIKAVTIPCPPLPEQAAIVRFIDHSDRRIRRYIRAKQRLIALLEEQRQAIIQGAVTRGMDPNVRMKPSGVEWLGVVPEHWVMSRVKTECLCLNHRRVPLSGTERGAMTLRRYDYYGASGIIDRVDDYLFDDELLLLAEDGANLVLRNLPLAIIARGKFWVNNHAHVLKPRRSNLEYLAAMMETINYLPWVSGAAQPKLTQDRLMSIAIALPPRQEQDGIIARVRAETSGLATTIERASREIALLREYRSRLIADAVTGKLDVREAAVGLPEEADKTDLLDENEVDAEAVGSEADGDLAAEEVEA